MTMVLFVQVAQAQQDLCRVEHLPGKISWTLKSMTIPFFYSILCASYHSPRRISAA
jgi:hypothetical protein